MKVEDEDVWTKFGFTLVGTDYTPVSYAPTGGSFWSPPAGAYLRVRAGGNAADTADGAGARSVVLDGLDDATGAAVRHILPTAGVLASDPTEAKMLRLNRAGTTAGTYLTDATTEGNNTGPVTIETTDGVAVMVIPALFGQSEQTHYAVPAGKCLHLDRMEIFIQSDANQPKVLEVRLVVRHNTLSGGVLTADLGAPTRRYWKVEDRIGKIPYDLGGQRLTELSEFWLLAKGEAAMSVSVSVTGRLTTMGTRKIAGRRPNSG